jgi:hypothetical protein
VFHAPFPDVMRQHVYKPYVTALASAEAEAAPLLGNDPVQSVRKWAVGTGADRVLNLLREARTVAFRSVDVVTRRAIASPGRSIR